MQKREREREREEERGREEEKRCIAFPFQSLCNLETQQVAAGKVARAEGQCRKALANGTVQRARRFELKAIPLAYIALID